MSTFKPLPDLARLEQAFKDAVGGLPNYKRGAAFEYVTGLRAHLEAARKDVNELAEQLHARNKQFVREATDLRNPMGTATRQDLTYLAELIETVLGGSPEKSFTLREDTVRILNKETLP